VNRYKPEVSQYEFYLNKEFISKLLDVDTGSIGPVENDWQDEKKTIPELKNFLDVLPRNPGIFPTESIS